MDLESALKEAASCRNPCRSWILSKDAQPQMVTGRLGQILFYTNFKKKTISIKIYHDTSLL